jgi:hypothetical protein
MTHYWYPIGGPPLKFWPGGLSLHYSLKVGGFLTHYLKCDSPNIHSGLINNPHWELNIIHGGWKSSSDSVPQEPFWFTTFPIVVPHKCSPPRTCSQWPFPHVRNSHCKCNKPKGELQLTIYIFFFNTMLWTPGEHGGGMSIQNNLGYDQEGIESFLGFRSLDQTQVFMCIFGHGGSPCKWVLQCWYWCNTVNNRYCKKI